MQPWRKKQTSIHIIYLQRVLYYFMPLCISVIKKNIFHAKTSVTIHFHTQNDLVQSHHRLSRKESDVAVSEQGTLIKLTWRWRTLHFHKTREFLYCPGAQSAQNKTGNEKRFIERGCGNGCFYCNIRQNTVTQLSNSADELICCFLCLSFRAS
jgi:hypothetical protein